MCKNIKYCYYFIDYEINLMIFGVICGWVVNVIFDVKFFVDGKEYYVIKNFGKYCIYGGKKLFIYVGLNFWNCLFLYLFYYYFFKKKYIL